MNLNKKIGFLLDNGFHPNFISSLNEGKINLLFEKMTKKEENKEATTSVVKQTKMTKSEFDSLIGAGKTVTGNVSQKGNEVIITNEGEIDEDEFYTDISGITQEPEQGESPDYPGSNRGKKGEQESLEEKFESKAQQGLFWARCNKCKTDDCKWCKMAKEFSKSTSKKQYKTMPEKKHPEKTVKYKKKETKEDVDYLKAVGSAITGGMKNNLVPNLINPKLKNESLIRNEFQNIIEKNLKPTMKKSDLLRLIEASMGGTETETKPDVKPDVKPGEKPTKTPNPFKKPNPSPAEAKVKQLQKKLEKLQDELDSLSGGEIDETYQDFMSKVKEKGFLNK